MIVETLTGVIAIAIATQLVKSLLEAAGLGTGSAWHDPIIWLVAFTFGIGGYVAYAAIGAPLTWLAVWVAAGQGLLAALGAVGSYHLVTHPYFDRPPAL
jgi:hypothetical protein